MQRPCDAELYLYVTWLGYNPKAEEGLGQGHRQLLTEGAGLVQPKGPWVETLTATCPAQSF